tara:strand:- start:268 stop:573 length:306 start_codon:yes stop_codon:yes gene_type:complete
MGKTNIEVKVNKEKTNIEVEVDGEVCKGCKLCVSTCPKGVFQMVKGGKTNAKGFPYAEIRTKDNSDDNGLDNCIGCANCYVMCPDVAIRVSYDIDEKDKEN